jgi:Zn-dependent membrane protease YugP
LAVYAQYKVRSTYARYACVNVSGGISAQQMAERILEGTGIGLLKIEHVKGTLSDSYDPKEKTLRLSDPTSCSIAAIGVAAHEAGHAIQDNQGFRPLAVRTAIVPLANFGSQLAFPLFFLGLIFRYQPFVTLGILAFSLAMLFTMVTLPVEFDASRRAVVALRSTHSYPCAEDDEACSFAACCRFWQPSR